MSCKVVNLRMNKRGKPPAVSEATNVTIKRETITIDDDDPIYKPTVNVYVEGDINKVIKKEIERHVTIFGGVMKQTLANIKGNFEKEQSKTKRIVDDNELLKEKLIEVKKDKENLECRIASEKDIKLKLEKELQNEKENDFKKQLQVQMKQKISEKEKYILDLKSRVKTVEFQSEEHRQNLFKMYENKCLEFKRIEAELKETYTKLLKQKDAEIKCAKETNIKLSKENDAWKEKEEMQLRKNVVI